jgi:hypothetical protein
MTRRHTRRTWRRAPEAPAVALAAMDHEADTSDARLPRWLARERYPLTEGATLHPRGKDLTGLLR